MEHTLLDHYLLIDDFSVTPRYQQVATGIRTAVEENILQPGDPLPSINEITFRCNVSKGTVAKAYQCLQQSGVIISSHRRLSRVAPAASNGKPRILLLLCQLGVHQQQWAAAFLQAIGRAASVETVVLPLNDNDLEHRLTRCAGRYHQVLVWLPPTLPAARWPQQPMLRKKLVVLHDDSPFPLPGTPTEKAATATLRHLLARLKNYRSLMLLPGTPAAGLPSFCQRHGLAFTAPASCPRCIAPGTLVLCTTEQDLVTLVQQGHRHNHRIGTEPGILALFESPLLRWLPPGITSLAPDYTASAAAIAALVLRGKGGTRHLPYQLTLRASV